ncbi:MAG TPA: tyrosine-type recombinase/integrase [Accumulibacter sp.]|uniref:tyrosine-type recombinase/integrase n=1 Tax=Accumulibacter sp. TaxID=2053492 RepID=UPI002C1DA016|nr:integrase arm-type DNA-binding domain-containing protein [Accumulibacter sp.]HRD87313.1 tyrosine-type recombinase/integrase [Accumulibacter sp.]
MPFKGTNLLTAKKVQSLKTQGRHSDGAGLYLAIDGKGNKRWVFMWQRDGKQREAGLGSALGHTPVSLAQAREFAEKMRDDLRLGLDPLKAREARKLEAKKAEGQAATNALPRFRDYAAGYIAAREGGWRNAKHARQWAQTILGPHCAHIHDTRVDEVTTTDVLAVLRPIWSARPETASRIRQRIEAILGAAISEFELQRQNPARWKTHLERLLPRQSASEPRHHPAMPWQDVPAFVARLRELRSPSARCLEFAIYTAARSGEARGLRWDEIDMVAGIWSIPGSRMKAGRPHRVPLAARPLEIIREMALYRRSEIVFNGARGMLSDMALSMTMRRMGCGAYVPHGLRSSFRDWVSEATAFPRELAELSLAHAVGDEVERAYARSDQFEKRRTLTTAWADHLDGCKA